MRCWSKIFSFPGWQNYLSCRIVLAANMSITCQFRTNTEETNDKQRANRKLFQIITKIFHRKLWNYFSHLFLWHLILCTGSHLQSPPTQYCWAGSVAEFLIPHSCLQCSCSYPPIRTQYSVMWPATDQSGLSIESADQSQPSIHIPGESWGQWDVTTAGANQQLSSISRCSRSCSHWPTASLLVWVFTAWKRQKYHKK